MSARVSYQKQVNRESKMAVAGSQHGCFGFPVPCPEHVRTSTNRLRTDLARAGQRPHDTLSRKHIPIVTSHTTGDALSLTFLTQLSEVGIFRYHA